VEAWPKVTTAGGIVKRHGYLGKMLLLQDTVITVAGWVGPTIAISLVIIAGSFAAIALVIAATAKAAAGQIENLGRAVENLRKDLAPALDSVHLLGDEARQLAAKVGNEAEDVVEASRALRMKVKDRLIDLEAVYDVLESEIEETALDVATTLRSFRTRASWYRWVRRLLGAGKHR
jgi:uncharacterized protein YoxC